MGDYLDASSENDFDEWKINCPVLYDTIITQNMNMEISKCCMLNGLSDTSQGWRKQEVCLGTCAEDQNFIIFADIITPGVTSSGKEGPFKKGFECIAVREKIEHEGKVLRLEIKGKLLASLSSEKKIECMDLSKNKSFNLIGELSGISGSISWANDDESLAACDETGKIYIWKVAEARTTLQTAILSNIFCDIGFQAQSSSLLGVVTLDSKLLFFDTRQSINHPHENKSLGKGQTTKLSFSPFIDYLCLTSGEDPVIKLWDLRNIKESLHEFGVHELGITAIEWSPTHEDIFASGSLDTHVAVWNCSHIGDDIEEEAETGPSELTFKHSGHQKPVIDLSWSKDSSHTLFTIDSGNLAHFWKIDHSVLEEG